MSDRTVFQNKKPTSWESWSDIPPIGEMGIFYPVFLPPVPEAIKKLFHSCKKLIIVV